MLQCLPCLGLALLTCRQQAVWLARNHAYNACSSVQTACTGKSALMPAQSLPHQTLTPGCRLQVHAYRNPVLFTEAREATPANALLVEIRPHSCCAPCYVAQGRSWTTWAP